MLIKDVSRRVPKSLKEGMQGIYLLKSWSQDFFFYLNLCHGMWVRGENKSIHDITENWLQRDKRELSRKREN